jgi:hypothetical protein
MTTPPFNTNPAFPTPQFVSPPPPLVKPYDQWGAVQIPAVPVGAFAPIFPGWGQIGDGPPNLASDPCLAVILDFLGTFLVTDENARGIWDKIGGQTQAVRTLWLHDPADAVFSTSFLPALFMWRQSAQQAYLADDYLQDTTVVKGLWVFPEADQAIQRQRAPFANVLSKLIGDGIERGRTPSWLQPGDTDTTTPGQGSLFYSYAAFDEFDLTGWQKAKFTIESFGRSDGLGQQRFFAIELTFKLLESRLRGIGRNPPYAPLLGATATISIAPAQKPCPWAPSTRYAAPSFVVPAPPNGSYYQLTTPGRSGATAPAWSTVPGATVSDGTAVWTCVGPSSTTVDSGQLENPPESL